MIVSLLTSSPAMAGRSWGLRHFEPHGEPPSFATLNQIYAASGNPPASHALRDLVLLHRHKTRTDRHTRTEGCPGSGTTPVDEATITAAANRRRREALRQMTR